MKQQDTRSDLGWTKAKIIEHSCDGIHHRWSYERPVHCLGCRKLFTEFP